MDRRQLQLTVYASLMAALICVGAYLTVPIPLGPVPLVLQNLFVFLAGLLLGSRWGLTSVGIYLLVGAIGLPVFVGGTGGLAHFLGPTGGYLFGFAAAAFVIGYLAERLRSQVVGDIVAVVAGLLTVFALGVPWLKAMTGMTWEKAFLVGMLPFLPGDALKAAAAVFLARAIRPMMKAIGAYDLPKNQGHG